MALTAARPDSPTLINGAALFTDKMWALENTRLYKPDPLKE
jgi:hypothetical protein